MHRSLLVALSSGLVVACAHVAAAPAIAPAAIAPAAPNGSSERSDDDDRVTAALAALSRPSVPFLASAWTTDAPPEPWLVVDNHAIALGEGPPIVTLEHRRVPVSDRAGARGWLVRPLYERLTSAARSPRGVAIDPEIPYQTVFQVLYTLQQSGQSEPSLITWVAAEVPLRAIPVSLPAYARRGLDQGDGLADLLRRVGAEGSAEEVLALADGVIGVDPSERAEPAREPQRPQSPVDPSEGSSGLSMSVLVTSLGFMVYGSGGNLAPGCGELSTDPVTTVPKLDDGVQSFAGLTRCLERIHALFPDESLLIVSADPEVPFRDVAGAIAAARGTAERPLFSHALLSPSMRLTPGPPSRRSEPVGSALQRGAHHVDAQDRLEH